MKTRMFVSAVLVFATFIFTSCDPADDGNGNAETYWSTNALTRLQLRGSVYTLTTSDGTYNTTKTFNSDGNIVSEQTPGRTSTYYTYENGTLISQTSGSTTLTYEYANTGKFVPIETYDFYVKGLVPGLSAIINGSERTDYKFVGSNLLIIHSTSSIPLDTTTIAYVGNYPHSQSFVTPWHTSTITMTFAENGMFKTYTNNMSGESFSENHAITFLADDAYQLLLKDVRSNTHMSETTSKTIDFTYNDHKDMTAGEYQYDKAEWSDYVYDENGNWTSRKKRFMNYSGTWGDWITETRSLTYF